MTDDIIDLTQPEEEPPRRPTAMWLVAVGMLLLFVPLFLTFSTLRAANQQAGEQILAVQTADAATPTVDPAVEVLSTNAAALREEVTALEALQTTLQASTVDWASAVHAIDVSAPPALSIAGLAQVENRLTITGRAESEAAVTTYVNALQESGLFARVIVQSIATEAVEQAAPTPTAEPDMPTNIYVGQAQPRTFAEPGDEDVLVFLAKAGRTYSITTQNLAPGVDTVLSVRVGGIVYTNDDRAMGDLGSQVVFEVPSGANIDVIIIVSSLGAVGAEQSYEVLVEEVPDPAALDPDTLPESTITAASEAPPPPVLLETPASPSAAAEPQWGISFIIMVELGTVDS